MKKVQRLLSMLLVCCLVVGMLPTMAMAASTYSSSDDWDGSSIKTVFESDGTYLVDTAEEL